MSQLYRPHFGGDPRILEMPGGLKATRTDGNTVPTGAGYEHGCTFRKHNGTTAADSLYVNVGSVTSANFQLVTTTTDAVALAATAAEINRAADVSSRIVNATASTLTVTTADHDGKIILLDRAAGIAVTIANVTIGSRFRFIVKTTFTGAAAINTSDGLMIGHALMGNNEGNAVVDWQSVAGSNNNNIDLLGTSNSTGGMAGQEIDVECIASGVYFVSIRGDANGTEATPFSSV